MVAWCGWSTSPNYVRLDAEQTLLQLAPLTFDASTLEVWGALLNGGRLVVMPPSAPTLDEISRVIVDEGVTTLWLTAGLFHLMVDEQLEGLSQRASSCWPAAMCCRCGTWRSICRR